MTSISQNELCLAIRANFVPEFFKLRFSFLFLLIGFGQVVSDVQKMCTRLNFSALQRTTLNLNVKYVTVIKCDITRIILHKIYLNVPNFLQDWNF